jgi:hypothetical protein
MAAEQALQLAAVALYHLGAGVGAGGEGVAVGVQHGVCADLGGFTQDIRVYVGVEGRRDAPGEDKPVARVKPVAKAGPKLVDVADVCGRTGVAQNGVDVAGLVEDGDVCASLTAGVHEVGGDALRLKGLLDVAAETTRSKAHSEALAAELAGDTGDVDALAAGVKPAGLDADGIPGDEPGEDQRLVDSRVEGDGDYHAVSGRIIP